MTPDQLDAIQRPEPERRAAVAYAIRDTLPTRNAWDMADAAIEAAGVPALLAYARDLEARIRRVEAIADISMDSEHGDPAFISGWQAALEEVQARLTEATEE